MKKVKYYHGHGFLLLKTSTLSKIAIYLKKSLYDNVYDYNLIK